MSVRGEKNPNAKLNEADVRQIKRMLSLGYPIPQMAKDYDVHRSTIDYIKKGETWSEVDEEQI